MKSIIIIGCGSHSSELVDYVEYINKNSKAKVFEVLGLIDDESNNYEHYNYKYEFMGSIKDHIVNPNVYYLMGIGNITSREKIIEDFKSKGAKFTGIIHPTALISETAEIGEGTVISHNASLGPKVKIGAFNVVNSRCTIGHDSQIGDNNFFSPQVVLGGYAKVGNANFFGTNSCAIPSIEIENNNTIMAGMVITSNVQNNETVFYRFKEKLMVRQ